MDARMLRKNVVDLLRGGQAFVPPRKALAGLAPENRNRRPAEGLRSVYEELEHMRIAQEDILRYTLDAGWESPLWPEGYWPRDNDSLADRRWKETLAGFFADLEEVIAMVQDKDRDLTARLPHGEGRTYLRQALLVADHNAYHLGAILQIRKILGDWKP